MIQHPRELEWLDPPIPDVETVPDSCSILVFLTTQEGFPVVTSAHPWEDKRNARRWKDLQWLLVPFYHSKKLPSGGYVDDYDRPIGPCKIVGWAWIIYPDEHDVQTDTSRS